MRTQYTPYIRFFRNPDFKQIEVRFSRYSRPAFKKHVHETYAIGVVEQGESSFFHQNTTRTIRQGMIALINPGEVHACNPKPDVVWTYRMFYVDLDLICDIADEVFEASEGLPVFTQTIVCDAWLYQALLDLYALMVDSDNTLEKESFLHETLARLLLKYSDRRITQQIPKQAFAATQKAYDYLMQHLSQNISLNELSSVAGLSAYHLLRIFEQRFGLPPHAFQLQQRINIAKKMLAEGVSIIEAAHELGFTDQSHFSKKFKALVGATPRQYQMAELHTLNSELA